MHLHMLQNIESKKINENTIVNTAPPFSGMPLVPCSTSWLCDIWLSFMWIYGNQYNIKMDTKWGEGGTNFFLLYLVYEDMLDSIKKK